MREVNWNNVKREAPKWFRDAKFGLFFHWGPYSVPAYQNEWYSRNMYCKGLEQNQYHEKTYGSLHDFGYKDFYFSPPGRFVYRRGVKEKHLTAARRACIITEAVKRPCFTPGRWLGSGGGSRTQDDALRLLRRAAYGQAAGVFRPALQRGPFPRRDRGT